ncbi:MAG TPA: GNAT family N-acetyltransferase [Candidatus Solibacter sp.]|jgi:ribosomal-protein-alanine N-acetyltransferase|nr:GNAT family N-acetyltransferase [Candidatus Solibacter sp.]
MGEGLILETERLVLRPFTLNDVEAMQAVLGDPVAMEYYPAPLTREGVEGWIRKNLARYEKDGYGKNAMVLKKSGEVIGDCGCSVQLVEERDQIEIGYNVRRSLWGRGYATEAARACMDYAFHQLGAQRVISMIRPENLSSRRVAEKNGLVCEKVIFWRNYDHCIYAKQKA